jgi:hypothetical protein
VREPVKPVFPAPRSESYARYAPVESKVCLDCHRDPHDGRFGQRCESCHVVAGWKTIRAAGGDRAFHDKTRYPLKGAHLDVDCKACHGPTPGMPAKMKGLAFSPCGACHSDAHAGQLDVEAARRCDTCHAVDDFSPTTFGRKDHAKTRYPLEGGHSSVACNACHQPNAALSARLPDAFKKLLDKRRRKLLVSDVSFAWKQPLDKCESCHRDVHQKQFEGRAGGCAACHRLAAFSNLTFDHDKDSVFALTGKHDTTKCAKCHPKSVGATGVVRYKPLKSDCASCHADVHLGLLADAKGTTDCARCHSTEDFSKRLSFRHEPPFTTFLLDGAHVETACEKCHPKVLVAPKVYASRYRSIPTTCEGCHVDEHQGAFRGFEP